MRTSTVPEKAAFRPVQLPNSTNEASNAFGANTKVTHLSQNLRNAYIPSRPKRRHNDGLRCCPILRRSQNRSIERVFGKTPKTMRLFTFEILLVGVQLLLQRGAYGNVHERRICVGLDEDRRRYHRETERTYAGTRDRVEIGFDVS